MAASVAAAAMSSTARLPSLKSAMKILLLWRMAALSSSSGVNMEPQGGKASWPLDDMKYFRQMVKNRDWHLAKTAWWKTVSDTLPRKRGEKPWLTRGAEWAFRCLDKRLATSECLMSICRGAPYRDDLLSEITKSMNFNAWKKWNTFINLTKTEATKKEQQD